MSYILYINQFEKVTEIPLPVVDNRKVKYDICGCELNMEIFDGTWKMLPPDKSQMKIDGKEAKSAEICDGTVINIFPDKSEAFAVMVKEIQAENNVFAKYSLTGKSSFTIGRTDDNDIVINDEYVGSHHCTISTDGNTYTLTDSSKNGTFINGERVNGSAVLKIFDTIYITGHKIIFLGSVIAVCETDSIKTKLPKADLKQLVNDQVYEDTSYFSRAPRRIEPFDSETVEIDDPPSKQKSRSQPLIFIIGPSVTMPIPILVSVLVNIASNAGAGRSGIMYLGTALSVILSALIGTGWALAHQMYNKKQLAADEKERTEAYTAYIENNRNLLEEKRTKNKAILEKNYLSTEELSEKSKSNPEILWNRNIYQNDFLTIRLGRGKVKLPAEIAVSKQRFSMNNDELCKYPHELHDKYEMIENCVSLTGLIQHKIIGMAGDMDKLPLIVNNMVCQLAALHCYTDVKIGFIGTESDREKYSWAKWLPHSFIRGTEARIICFDDNSRENVTYELAALLRRRAESLEEGENKNILLPHIVLFCTSAEIIRNSVFSRYMSSPAYLGITFVLVYGGMNTLPNECKAVIECSGDFSGFYMLDGEITDENHIDFDLISVKTAESFARSISGYYVSEISTGSIPQSVDYFEMIGIGKLEHWDLIRQYKSNRSYEGIKAFIGLSQGNEPVYLDIHDKQDGPHGLVAGTTGSGKSETLQTFILSLAMNYSPDEVAFVLIDYKGGGMANCFEGLPHIAGMLTNLSDDAGGEMDFSMTRRMCSSLRSEIKRRQSVFKNYDINHIDKYQRLYREGKADTPMPHLIIISDEFAELKKEQPEFIKELISVARVGRSLGIHLILATQKPSGVVDDEIWSNSRFRICLRVQDKQDSIGMLKRPDAAYITESGRAFLQIGNDEIFEEFQSGYSGVEYEPKESVVSAADSEASIIEISGVPAVVRSKRKSNSKNKTELEAAVRFISDCAKENELRSATALWLPPLNSHIVLNDIDIDPVQNQIAAVYGFADNYEQQMQYPCVIDLMSCSNLKICGTAGSGKTTLLQTILCSAVKKYSPEQFTFYIMDFSSRTFKMFKRLPHCGGVVYEEETEASERLIKLMFDIIDERKRLFESEDIGSYKEYIKMHTLPLVVFAIDNFAVFSELYENYSDMMLKLMHDGVRYGIQVVVTINNSSELKYKMRSYVLDSMVLHMAEKGEYTEFIGKNPAYVPAPISGRGLTVYGGEVLEYQAALPTNGDSEYERSENMKKLFAEISERYKSSPKAKRIPIIPENVKYSDMLAEGAYSNELLIGYNFETTEPYSVPLSSFFCYCVSDNGIDGISLFMNNIAEYAEYNNITVKAVKLNSDMNLKLPENSEVFTDLDGIHTLTEYLGKEFSERNTAVPQWNEDQSGISRDNFMAEKFGRVFVFIDDMFRFCEVIYSDPDKDKYAGNLDMFFGHGKNHGVHFFAGYNSAKKTYLSASQTFKSENFGIHLSGEANNQNILELDVPLQQKLKKLPFNIGQSVENKQVTTIFVPERK